MVRDGSSCDFKSDACTGIAQVECRSDAVLNLPLANTLADGNDLSNRVAARNTVLPDLAQILVAGKKDVAEVERDGMNANEDWRADVGIS